MRESSGKQEENTVDDDEAEFEAMPFLLVLFHRAKFCQPVKIKELPLAYVFALKVRR